MGDVSGWDVLKWIVHVLCVIVRTATNMLAVSVWWGIGLAVYKLFDGGNIFSAFGDGFVDGFTWSFTTTAGWVVAAAFGVLGLIHGIRMAVGETYWGVGFLGFILDNTWSLPNSVVGSLFATVTLGIGIDKSDSKGTGRLVLKNGVFSGYATTLGSVTAGTSVPKHEMVHVVQAWLTGPFFYPIFIANYVVNLVPYWWLIKCIFNAYPNAPIENFGHYFTRGVYPFTIFEAIAYGVEGSPP